jgi:hypothetical protein
MRVLERDGIGRLINKCVYWHEKCERICCARHSSCKMRVQMGSLARLLTNLGLFGGGGSSPFPLSCYRNTLGMLYFTLLYLILCSATSVVLLSGTNLSVRSDYSSNKGCGSHFHTQKRSDDSSESTIRNR